MTSETAPERIWIDNEHYEHRWHVLEAGWPPPVDYPHVFGQYLRSDLVAAKDARIKELEAENQRLLYVLGGVAAAIDTGRNEPLVIWREQIDIARAALSREGE